MAVWGGIGLRGKSLSIIALIFALMAAVGTAVIAASTTDLLDYFGVNFVRKSALLHKERILSPIRRETALARKLADSAVIQEWMLNEDDPTLRRLAFAELRSYRNSFQEGAYFIAIASSRHYYFDDGTYTGRELLQTLDPANPEDAWFFTSLDLPASVSLNVDDNAALGVTKLWINVAIERNGRRLGLTGTGMDLTGFVDEFIKSTEPGVSAMILSGTGAIQAHQNPGLIDQNTLSKSDANQSTVFALLDDDGQADALRSTMARLSADATDVETLTLRIDGREQFAAVAYMPEIDWYVLTLVDAAQAFDVQRFLPYIVLLVLLSAAVVAAFVLLLERVVLAPLLRLTRSTEAVARGSYVALADSHRRDEIGQLTRAFNHMVATVREHAENLEHKVQERTEALRLSNRKLEETNRHLLDSLDCARLIQSSILPQLDAIEGIGESFVVWRPRDTVGGDLYLARQTRNGFMIGVLDCVGHGVPGAFMTMMAHALLDQALAESEDPGEVLTAVDRRLRDIVDPEREGRTGVGLDAGLCLCEPAARRLVFAGARISLHRCDDAGIAEIKGERRSLGDRRRPPGAAFRNQVLALHEGQTWYLATDGILDQSGGRHGFGFGTRRLHRLLRDHAALPLTEQGAVLVDALAAYQGARPQRDDITVIGFRPSGPPPRTRDSRDREGADRSAETLVPVG